MSIIVVRKFPAADRKGTPGGTQGATCRFPGPRLATRTKASLSAAAADFTLIYPTCGHFGARETLVNESALGLCGRALTGTGKTVAIIVAPNANPVRRNSVGGKAPRSLTFLGNALLQPRKQSSSGFAECFHPEYSISDAVELHLQSTTGVFGNVRKAFGEIRNA